MGQTAMRRPVESLVVKRSGGTAFRTGFAEMNGWRNSMEDANVIYAQDTWGFFGVFDGHGGSACSEFIAERYLRELEENGPPSDKAMSSLALKFDQEFLDSEQTSGSTGTFVVVTVPEKPGGKYKLRVGNVGDSRILLAHEDGTIYQGPGTDFALTTDHKPDLKSEEERIYRCGGNVQTAHAGVSRVNGDLAVSRAFGDRQHKMTGGPNQEDRPVCAVPELLTLECDPTDFLILVCDGISEGDFPNAEVCRLAAEKLKPPSERCLVDPAEAAKAVCQTALEKGSKDNLSCMIVLLSGGEVPGKPLDYVPAPFDVPESNNFRKAYKKMAEHAGLSLAEALDRRCSMVTRELSELDELGEDPKREAEKQNLREELKSYGEVPVDKAEDERIEWFETWLSQQDPEHGESDLNRQVNAVLQQQGVLLTSPSEQVLRISRVACYEELRTAVDEHTALKWDERLRATCAQEGHVLRDDENDGTSQVQFLAPISFKAWLPTNMLRDIKQKVGDLDALKSAVDGSSITWDARLETCAGQSGYLREKNGFEKTSSVYFPGLDAVFSLPDSALTSEEDKEAEKPTY